MPLTSALKHHVLTDRQRRYLPLYQNLEPAPQIDHASATLSTKWRNSSSFDVRLIDTFMPTHIKNHLVIIRVVHVPVRHLFQKSAFFALVDENNVIPDLFAQRKGTQYYNMGKRTTPKLTLQGHPLGRVILSNLFSNSTKIYRLH